MSKEEKKSLIRSGNRQLNKVGSTLALTDKLLKNSKKAWYKKFSSLFATKDYSAMLIAADSAMTVFPRFEAALNCRGIAKSQLKDLSGAMEDFTHALTYKPDYAKAYNNRGSVQLLLRNYRQALRDYTKALRLKPYDERIYYNRGDAKYGLNDGDGAFRDYNKATELNPEIMMQSSVTAADLRFLL